MYLGEVVEVLVFSQAPSLFVEAEKERGGHDSGVVVVGVVYEDAELFLFSPCFLVSAWLWVTRYEVPRVVCSLRLVGCGGLVDPNLIITSADTGSFSQPLFIPLANLLLALILGPKRIRTNGTIVKTALIPPRRLLAPGKPRFRNIASEKSGKTAPRILRQKDWAAKADEA